MDSLRFAERRFGEVLMCLQSPRALVGGSETAESMPSRMISRSPACGAAVISSFGSTYIARYGGY